MPPLILASSSQYRRELLARLGLPFEVLAPAIDETLWPGERAAAATRRLAQAKAAAVALLRPEALILASDQLAELKGRPLGKPGNEAEARRQLQAEAGRTVTYSTAVALRAPGTEKTTLYVDCSRVILRTLGAEAIARYVSRERPLDCAGALRLEGLGAALCERIETADPTALIGLPLIAVARLLRGCGYQVP